MRADSMRNNDQSVLGDQTTCARIISGRRGKLRRDLFAVANLLAVVGMSSRTGRLGLLFTLRHWSSSFLITRAFYAVFLILIISKIVFVVTLL